MKASSIILWLVTLPVPLAAQSPLCIPAPGSPFPLSSSPGNVVAGDVNRDHKVDLLIASGKSHSVFVLLGDGKGGFTQPTNSPIRTAQSPSEMALAEFNGDGDPDMAFIDHNLYDVVVLVGDGRGNFAPAPGSPFKARDGTHPHTHGLAAADINADGKQDLVTANNEDGDVAVLLGDGKGGFARAPGSPFAVGKSPYPLAVGDLNGDTAPDIAVPNSGPENRTITVLLNDGKGVFRPAPKSPFEVAEAPFFVAIGDVNGDQSMDLVATHDDRSLASILLGDGQGSYKLAPNSPADLGGKAWGVVVADVDGDGSADLVAAANDDARVLLGDKRGNFKPAPGSPYPAGKGAWRLAVADFNGDDKLDIATSNLESDSVTVLLGK